MSYEAQENSGFVQSTPPLVSKNKKKKKSKGRGKSLASRGPCALPRNRGTGFEEFFADPPLRTEEAAEEKLEVYAYFIPFEERIQSCIQRFRSRRRLQDNQPRYFNEYLFLGGIDTRQNSFSGLDQKDLQDLTPAERRDATATDTVHTDAGASEIFYNGDTIHWSVDFAGVAAGFLSTSLGPLTGFEEKQFDAAIGVVEHFLRYVLQHDVCPEYKADVEAAILVCRQARKEWPILNQLTDDLPGLFNLAATEFFATMRSDDWSLLSFTRPDNFDAKAYFLATCALCGEFETLNHFSVGKLETAKEYTCTVQVTRVERPSQNIIERFSALCIEGSNLAAQPVGRFFFKKAIIEDGWEEPEVPVHLMKDQLWVYLEDVLLINMVPGMRMEMVVIELNTGVRFIKTILKIVPSFYTFLPQQMMRHFTPLREHDRAAPSIHDPAAEDVHVAGEHE